MSKSVLMIEGLTQLRLPDGQTLPATVKTSNDGSLVFKVDIFKEEAGTLHRAIMHSLLSEQGISLDLFPLETTVTPERVSEEAVADAQSVTFGEILARKSAPSERHRKATS